MRRTHKAYITLEIFATYILPVYLVSCNDREVNQVVDPVQAEWARFIAGESLKGDVKEWIRQSWWRSQEAKVSYEDFSGRRVSDEEFHRRTLVHADMMSLAIPHLDWLETLLPTITSSGSKVGLVDNEGILLYEVGDLRSTIEGLFQPGCDLSESSIGTFAVGLTLLSGEPMSVHGAEHYGLALHDFHSYAVPLKDELGDIVGAFFMICRKRLQPHGSSMLCHLARFINKELIQRKNTEAIGLLARMSSFIAHELGNPLTVLKGSLGLLARRVSDERGLEMVRRCERITEQMVALVKDLRALGGARADLQRINVKEFLENLVYSLPVSPGVCVRATCDPWLTVLGSPTLLNMAIENLVRNAQDAMVDGGQVDIIAERTPVGVRISVCDNGPGIPVAMRGGLFHCAVTTKQRGSGMGLLLVRSIVENAHGGRVSYAPNRPHGSVFHIDLTERAAEHVTSQRIS
jgi:signal transduction histidine kinase